MKKKGNELLYGSFFVLKLSIVVFPPQAPHKATRNYIEKLQQDFLYGGLGEEFKFHLISWSKVCSSISEGELEVRNL
jgi:hypothetical protein